MTTSVVSVVFFHTECRHCLGTSTLCHRAIHATSRVLLCIKSVREEASNELAGDQDKKSNFYGLTISQCTRVRVGKDLKCENKNAFGTKLTGQQSEVCWISEPTTMCGLN